MKLTIHRGTKEIGGTCVELAAEGERIVLDLGLPLSLPRDYRLPRGRDRAGVGRLLREGVLPRVPGLYGGTGPRPAAVVISHPHLDHYGLVRFANPRIPCVTGRDSRRIMALSGRIAFPPFRVSPAPAGWVLRDRHSIRIGPFQLTPYLADHSAFDAYSILVEAAGKRLFYSGDFRGHGRKRGLFEKLLKNPPRGIDALLMEGTTISGGHDGFDTEEALERHLTGRLRLEKSRLALLVLASQNVDRLVTAFKACVRAGRTFLVDPYTAAVLEMLGRSAKIPRPGWKGMGVLATARTAALLKRRGLPGAVGRAMRHAVDAAAIDADPGKFAIVFRSSMIGDFAPLKSVDGSILFFSLWKGYLRDPSFKTFNEFLRSRSISLEEAHVSGHATVQDLQRLASAISPKVTIPVHTNRPQAFSKLFGNVSMLSDGVGAAI